MYKNQNPLYNLYMFSLSLSDRTATVALLPGEQGKSGTGAETSLAGAGQQTQVGWFLKGLKGEKLRAKK